MTSGRYPWSKPLLLVHAGEPAAHLSAFIDFVDSQGARKMLAMTGYCTA